MPEKIIEAKEIKIANLFSEDYLFNIPIYQRPFSWNSDNFEQLFDDILDSMSSEEGHFLGSTLLQEQGSSFYDLVDGQQRMTALTILLAVIRDTTNIADLKERIQSYIYQKEDTYKGLPESMRVKPWEELKGLFRQYVYSPGGTQKYVEDFMNGNIQFIDAEDPRYHLYEAIYVFTKKISEVVDMESFVRHLLRDVYMVYIKTTSLTSAYRLFNVLNTRGLPLSPSDILKSENLGLIKDGQKREQYGKIWRTMEEELGREELANVVSYIRTIKKKEKAKLGIIEEYQQVFKAGMLERGTAFVDYVKEIADIYQEKVLSPEIASTNLEDRNRYKVTVDLMNRFVPFSDWVPPLLAFCHKFKSDEFLLDFISKLEKKVVIEWAAGFSATERITSLNRIIKMIEKMEDPKLAVDKMLFYRADDDTAISGIDFGNDKEIEKNLRSKLNDARFYSLHGGKFAKYILLRTDMELWDLENFPGYPGVVTVEHVLPQTPSENSEWVKIFSKEQRDEWTNKFGNLVLLSGRKNSRAQNYDFARKKDVYFKEKSTPFRITQELEKIDTWNVENLTERHNRLADKVIAIFVGS